MKKKNKKNPKRFDCVKIYSRPFSGQGCLWMLKAKIFIPTKIFLKNKEFTRTAKKSFHESWTAFLNGGFPVYFLYLSLQ